MNDKLRNKKIAILATSGFEESELLEPKRALESCGAKVEVVSLNREPIRSWYRHNWGEKIRVDRAVSEASCSEYDGLVLPGGVINPDTLRRNKPAVNFVNSFFESGKPVAAICHGPQMLIEAAVVNGRRVTSYDSIKTDLINAGAQWSDDPVVVDQGLVTSRSPADMRQFIDEMIDEFAEGAHEGQVTHQSL